MHTPNTFGLFIQPGDTTAPARVSIVLQHLPQAEDGRLFITPECTSLDELEGQINALQDDLDQLRARAEAGFSTGGLKAR